jgi:tRNA pseudouridine38-40 synthase
MPRFKLTIEYDGTRYSGWQMQKGSKSIQGEILDACRDLFGDGVVDLYGSGRTDGGVHAIGQVAHLEVETDLSPLKIRYGINDRVPPDICVLNTERADPAFHARYDAIARSYIYQISRRRTAFGKKYVWWIKDKLDIESMNRAASYFTGMNNFSSFTDSDQEQGSTKVEIKHSLVHEFGDMLLYHVIGSHFLWKQVRRMTGVIVEAGRGKFHPDDVPKFLRHRSDVPAKFTAPPSGLFLERVYYRGEVISFIADPVFNIKSY